MKKMIIIPPYKYLIAVFGIAGCLFVAGCKNYLDIPLPVDKISGSSAFTNDKSCAATLNPIFAALADGSHFDGTGIGFKTGLYTDELTNYAVSELNTSIYSSVVTPGQVSDIWTAFYAQIYRLNLSLEGISSSTALLNHRDQWLGEAYFLRALTHFYLTNIYGDIPLVLTSDYRSNNVIKRSPQDQVYAQVIEDLKKAESLLPETYSDVSGSTTEDRGRPNKGAAKALLARVYLYTSQWQAASDKASEVISQTGLYELAPLADAFAVAGNKESIITLAPVSTNPIAPYVKDRNIYVAGLTAAEIPAGRTITSFGVNGALSKSLLGSFEPGDQRFTQWIFPAYQVTGADTVKYFIPFKYKSRVNGEEYEVVLRLAELYLIRAEAKAELNDPGGAKTDLNLIRHRAGLGETPATTKEAIINAILRERRVELFSEEGHRFFDLRRRKLLDEVMAVEAPLKNGSWQGTQQFWPIAPAEILANPNLTQTPGY